MDITHKKPEIIVFAGPNGSGKSTFTELLKPPMDYINADEIKKSLKCSDLEAAQIAESQRESHLENLEEFCFEIPFRIFKKRKDIIFYDDCDFWSLSEIRNLTGIKDMEMKNLN